MNSFFMSLSNEGEEADHTLEQQHDPWLDSSTQPSNMRNYISNSQVKRFYFGICRNSGMNDVFPGTLRQD